MWLSTVWVCLAIVLLNDNHPLSAILACGVWAIHKSIEVFLLKKPSKT